TRAWKAAAEGAQALADLGRYFDRSEQAWHDSRSFTASHALDQGFDRRKRLFHHDVDAFRCRVNAVRLVQHLMAGDAVEKERHQHEPVFLREIAINRIEGGVIFLA